MNISFFGSNWVGYLIGAVIAIVVILPAVIRVLKEYERGVIFRLGRVIKLRGPGIIVLIPLVDKIEVISLRIYTMDVPSQDVITKDNVSVKVNAVVYLKVVDPIKATIEVNNFLYATEQLSQTTLRSVLGQVELDELLGQRDKINSQLQEILDEATDPWGVKVTSVETKYVDLPQEMQRAMAKQAEAERLRRAKIINAEGEFQASKRLLEASQMLEQSTVAIQLRYLQTLTDVAVENNSTILFPLPIELFKSFMGKLEPENKDKKIKE